MSPWKIVGLALVIAGVAALVYGGFGYTKETHDVSVGPVDLSVHEKERVNVPKWAGIAGIAVGLALLVVPAQRRE